VLRQPGLDPHDWPVLLLTRGHRTHGPFVCTPAVQLAQYLGRVVQIKDICSVVNVAGKALLFALDPHAPQPF